MRVHRLNCASFRPLLPPVESATLCILVHAGNELILVDTGLGRRDAAAPTVRMRLFRATLRSPLDVSETAYHQIARLGYRPEDVTHIVLTHLHLEHTGGLPDFPQAMVHVTRAEVEAAMNPRGIRRLFYAPEHWRHGPRWRIHDDAPSGDWFGFRAIEVAEIDATGILLIPLPGHSPGHVGVAVETPAGWLFHCGDALPFGGLESPAPDRISGFACGPHIQRLRRLADEERGRVEILSSHIPLQEH